MNSLSFDTSYQLSQYSSHEVASNPSNFFPVENLPLEIFEHVISFTDPSSLMRTSSVTKRWNEIIRQMNYRKESTQIRRLPNYLIESLEKITKIDVRSNKKILKYSKEIDELLSWQLKLGDSRTILNIFEVKKYKIEFKPILLALLERIDPIHVKQIFGKKSISSNLSSKRDPKAFNECVV
jgi:hypothetical protein